MNGKIILDTIISLISKKTTCDILIFIDVLMYGDIGISREYFPSQYANSKTGCNWPKHFSVQLNLL